ncbi:MAG: GNAT family N-acetyltransferase [Paludibacteraceae bacterium]|nr:GNAT family N-acetyltransferase [Paludibacteraceae bacterium]
MNKLPENFELDRYGLHVRLVREEDAEFIVRLRSDEALSRYINKIDASIEKQKQWIRDYKEREKAGKDYYFLFSYNGNPVGLNRIYDIKEEGTFICGSLVFNSPNYKLASFASWVIVREIAFEELGLQLQDDYIGTHKDNKSVLACQKMMGSEVYGERKDPNGIYIQSKLTKENFLANKAKVEHMFLK